MKRITLETLISLENIKKLKANLLITGGGTGNAFATAEAIKNNFENEINLIVADINPRHLVSAGNFADYYEEVPLISDTRYKEAVLGLAKKYEINALIPFIDSDVLEMSKWSEDGSLSSDVFLQVKSTQIAEICGDKQLAFFWLKENGINTPETFSLNEEINHQKFIIKPKSGFGSVVREVSVDEVSQLDEIQKYIGQEMCSSPEVTIDVFYSESDSLFRYLCRERVETKAGVCTKARIFIDPELERLARFLATSLRLSFFCFQVMQLGGKWAVTDINPRLGAGTAMSTAVGMDFFAAMIAVILKKNPRPYIDQFLGEAYVTRQYVNIKSR